MQNKSPFYLEMETNYKFDLLNDWLMALIYIYAGMDISMQSKE